MERYSIESSGAKAKPANKGGKAGGRKLFGIGFLTGANAAYVVVGGIIFVLLASTSFFGYQTFSLGRENHKLQDENKALEQQLNANHQSSTINDGTADSSASQPTDKLSQSQKDSLQADLNTKNFSSIKPLLSPDVLVVRTGHSNLSGQTPEQVINELSFLSGAVPPWIIVTGDTLTNWQNGAFGSFFDPGTLVFQSSNDYVVSFDFTPDGQIDTVFMTDDAGVLSQSAGGTGDNAPVSQPDSATGSE